MRDAATRAAITPRAKGSGGKGGNTDADMNRGADGIAATRWDFGAMVEPWLKWNGISKVST